MLKPLRGGTFDRERTLSPGECQGDQESSPPWTLRDRGVRQAAWRGTRAAYRGELGFC